MSAPVVLNIVTGADYITCKVQGSDGKTEYSVSIPNPGRSGLKRTCDCPHFVFRQVQCKHMEATVAYLDHIGLI